MSSKSGASAGAWVGGAAAAVVVRAEQASRRRCMASGRVLSWEVWPRVFGLQLQQRLENLPCPAQRVRPNQRGRARRLLEKRYEAAQRRGISAVTPSGAAAMPSRALLAW